MRSVRCVEQRGFDIALSTKIVIIFLMFLRWRGHGSCMMNAVYAAWLILHLSGYGTTVGDVHS